MTDETTNNPALKEEPVSEFKKSVDPLFWVIIGVFAVLWVVIVGPSLSHAWNSDKAMSHGPLVPIIAGALLYMKKDEIGQWKSANPLGLAGLLFSTLIFLLAMWADVEFAKPLSLIGMMFFAILHLGGWGRVKDVIGPLGFLLFMIPWPTTLTERLAFPLQITSSTYAAMAARMMGLAIERDGVNIHVMADALSSPTYSITVALACSGLTSLMVLMALTYVIAYFTPLKMGWRALMMATILPFTLIANTIRLAIILVIGGEFHNPKLANWVHDNEGPFLIFFCSLALMGIRSLMIEFVESRKHGDDDNSDSKQFINEMVIGEGEVHSATIPVGDR